MAKKRMARAEPKYNLNDDDDDLDQPGKTPAETVADALDDDYFGDEPPVPGPVKAPVKPVGPKRVAAKTAAVASFKDDRNLKAKDKKRLAAWKGPNRGKLLDTFFRRQRDEARKKFGHNSVFIGSEAEGLVIGIPCPALAFEYVITQNCFPLGLVIQIVAKHGVGKSALLAEFGRWFDMAGGGMELCENETKFNSFWYESIQGSEVWERVPLHRCKSVEDWQRHLTWAIKNMQSDMIGTKQAPGPGKIFPVLFGVDSIMGKMSEENQEKVIGSVGKKGKLGTTGAGFAQARSYPIEAGSITKYMRTVPQLFDDWPFALVLVNHLRMVKSDDGIETRTKTGGEQVNFQESFELELKKIGGPKKKIACSDFEGIPLELSCEKNSFGPTGRKAQVRLLWWHEQDEVTGLTTQKSVWDWDWATVHLLNNLLHGENASTYLRSRLKAIDFHLEVLSTGDLDNQAWCKSAGMSKKDACTWAETGAIIREDKELVAELRKALGIAHRPILKGDYMSQMESLAEKLP